VSKSGTHDQKVWGGGSLTDFAGLDQALDVGVVLERALPVPESEKEVQNLNWIQEDLDLIHSGSSDYNHFITWQYGLTIQAYLHPFIHNLISDIIGFLMLC
jgi:hypothetical protein